PQLRDERVGGLRVGRNRLERLEAAVLQHRGGDLRAADVDADEPAFAHRSSSAAAALSSTTVSVPAPGRTCAAGADSSGSRPNARRTAAALSPPATRKTTSRAVLMSGNVNV